MHWNMEFSQKPYAIAFDYSHLQEEMASERISNLSYITELDSKGRAEPQTRT